MSDDKLSVVIVTRNRPKKLLQCLLALSKNSLSDFEVVVVDQSDREMTDHRVRAVSKNFKQFHYIYSRQKGKSKGLNLGIQASHSSLIAFTDDDCIPEKNWLSVLYKNFNRHSEVVGIFGRTLPFRPEKNPERICPSIFEQRYSKNTIIDKPCVHSENIGFGNNMAFRKTVFKELGGFKEWLGPGSLACAAEDAEFALRALISGKKLLHANDVIMFHDKWLTGQEDTNLFSLYLTGGLACYGYYSLKKNEFAKRHLKDILQQTMGVEMQKFVKKLAHLEKDIFPHFLSLLRIHFAIALGSFVAFYHFYTDKD